MLSGHAYHCTEAQQHRESVPQTALGYICVQTNAQELLEFHMASASMEFTHAPLSCPFDCLLFPQLWNCFCSRLGTCGLDFCGQLH
jgi:hypothetical protein